MSSSPQLFAGYHVLHRLIVPRHPPYALINLIFRVHVYFSFSSLEIFRFRDLFKKDLHVCINI